MGNEKRFFLMKKIRQKNLLNFFQKKTVKNSCLSFSLLVSEFFTVFFDQLFLVTGKLNFFTAARGENFTVCTAKI